MKKIFMWTVMVLILLIAIDLMASYFLFHYDRLGNDDTIGSGDQGGRFPSTVLVSKMLARLGESGQTPGKKPGCKLTSRPGPFYQRHPELTWMVFPGKYDVFICPNDKTSPLPFKWTVTMVDDISPNRRATSIDEIRRDKRIYIFGDSFIFGYGPTMSTRSPGTCRMHSVTNGKCSTSPWRDLAIPTT